MENVREEKKKKETKDEKRRRGFVLIGQVAPVLLKSKHLLPVAMEDSFSKKEKRKIDLSMK